MVQWIKDLRDPQDIYAAQLPLLKLMAWTGIIPAKLKGKPGNRRLVTTWFDFLNTFVHIIFFVVCYTYAIRHHCSIVGQFFKNDITVMGDRLQLVAQVFTTMATYGLSAFRREKFFTIIQKMAEVDNFAAEIGINVDYKSTQRFIWFFLVYKTAQNVFYVLMTLGIFWKENIYISLDVWVSFFFPLILISLLVSLYICIMSQIKHRFYLLNRILSCRANVCPLSKGHSKDVVFIRKRSFGISSNMTKSHYMTMTHEQILQIAAQIHHALADICEAAEKYFSLKMLTIITIAFVIIIFNSYYILELVVTSTTQKLTMGMYDFIGFFSYQIIIYSMSIICIVQTSSSVVQQSEELGVWVHKILNQGATVLTDTVRMMLIQFSLQLTHRRIKFTACGLFELDKRLLFTIIGTLTTYLVILIQFSISGIQKSDRRVVANSSLEATLQEFAEMTSTLLSVFSNNSVFYGKCSQEECLSLNNFSVNA
ncbi:putative gustatory receptor 28b [Culicoides brevitarsis]|uniref:putative gustatory receptor 28b n=1 Tax=Culicoides brevitarsis TaxID=469753 RepID=UPI00307C58D5